MDRVTPDTPEVAQLLADDGFVGRLAELAGSLGRDPGEVTAEAAGYLREMGAMHSARVMGGWSRFTRWMFRAHELLVDEEYAGPLREIDRKYSLLFLFSHRSYLDGAALPLALDRHGIDPAFTLGGANLNIFPVGQMARRSGIIYIRRSTRDLPVYKLALRAYIGQLIRNRKNLSWSIEGGRTRTGKLRPPAYGILRYVVDSIEAAEDIEAVVVPVSIVYEQLHEVGLMTAEARGGRKRPEDMRWLVNFARLQAKRLGRAYLDLGEPLLLREQLAALRAEDPSGRNIVERIALDTSHRINRATPVTATAVVCLAMLAADRALTLDGVLATVAPMARYIGARHWPVAGAADLTDPTTIERTLRELSASGVLTSYEGGTDTVWSIRAGQHLVAAFYRNAVIHILVDRAIGELSLVAASEGGPAGLATATEEALRLRDLLKFDFFFARRRDFAAEMAVELAVIDPAAGPELHEFTPADARRWLEAGDPLVSPLVLRPFLDAYHLVADRLAAREEEPVDEPSFLDECLRVGRQWALQGRLASEESVSLELFKPVLRLAAHRDLLGPTAPNLHKRRTEFRDEIRETLRRIDVVAGIAPR
ncbi:lysophospholipid acyltransferase [Virgisporangium aurantiacum]|uniref:Putative acyltransferase plsB1 n=1 Tax=Virgisporangium aurantiacum TaxID=175570 RepID=A0A8J3ZGD5_9ACTN|nr:lysophospholipid acyltransferase [Virgisporangium aurantiacum]GIJ63634.1 putative acyltransferase plsB1 [Virgisporangium aurantiacum]